MLRYGHCITSDIAQTNRFFTHLLRIIGICDKTYIIDITLNILYHFGYDDLGAIYAKSDAGEKWIGLSNNPRL
jgi:hypothetical protein